MSDAEKLVLFDLDGTLIDDQYQVTDPEIYDAIAAAQAAGWQLGLNSDTPYEALTVWRERFGMNGPIVAEKGAVVEIAGVARYDETVAALVAVSRNAIAAGAQQQGAAVWSGNPVEALRAGLRTGEPGQTVVLLNDLSRCSLRFFVRVAGADGVLEIDDQRTQSVIATSRPLFPQFAASEEDDNPAFGLLIVAQEGISKRTGTQQLLASMGIARCVMVGNSISDYCGSDISEHLAVANASGAYKDRASVVSNRPLTAGCTDLLRQLLERATGPEER